MARSYYLQIQGIDEIAEARVPVEGLPSGAALLEVSSFSWGVGNSIDPTGRAGAGAGKASFSELTVVTRANAYSPSLLQRVAGGQFSPQVLLLVLDTYSGRSMIVEQYALQNAVFTGLQISGAQGGDRDQQQLSIGYRAITHKVALIDPNTGSGNNAVEKGWDLAANKPL
jgi:type VI protein secretion system component Hcp